MRSEDFSVSPTRANAAQDAFPSSTAEQDRQLFERIRSLEEENRTLRRRVMECERVEEALRASEARQAFLLQLNDRLRPLGDPVEIQMTAATLLGQHLGASRVGYAEDQGDGETVVVTRNYTDGVPGLDGRYHYDDYGPALLRELKAGRTVVRSDIQGDPTLTDEEKAAHTALQLGATVNVPLVKGGHLVAILFMHHREAHAWSAEELALAEAVAERTWAAVERARAKEELATELRDTKLLQEISSALTQQDSVEDLYNKIIDAAVTIMRSDYASMQMLYPERGSGGELRLLAFRGFNPKAAEFWEWVRADSESTCGVALRTGKRSIEADVRNSTFMEGSEDQTTYLHTGIRAVQTTPLLSRAGNLVGMISTHWKSPHNPSERDLRLLDILARQAADLLERKVAEENLKAAKAAAEEASLAKSEFLANMSHEIRTPMTVFMAATEYLLQIDKNPERRKLLNMAEQSAHRLRSIIDDILDFSRIEARRVDIEAEPFELRACVRQAAEIFALPASEKNLRIETNVAPEAPETVLGDPGRIGQVLVNLIGNAMKFTHQGEICITAQPRGDFLEFTVADTGIGIPEEKLNLLFQSFSQVDSSFTRRFGGTGLGLAISKGLVELMGGEISVRSRQGEGSVFIFTIPLKIVANPSVPIAEGEQEEPSFEQTPAARILLADDEPLIRDMITLMLAQRGLRVEVAESGEDAVEQWGQGEFDLVLMDLQMPGMNGLEATRAIREREADSTKRTSIVGLTAHARPEIHAECLSAGMDLVLTKPIQMKDLYAAINRCLSEGKEATTAVL